MNRLAKAVLFGAVAFAAAGATSARASVSLLLEQPYGGLGMVNPTGHAALYLDHVCAASPLELRACRPGELGVVISRYDAIAGRDWIAIPLVPYLYAVASPAEIPQTASRERVAQLRDLYRRHALESVAPDLPNGKAPEGNWYELVGSAYMRRIYGFSLATTPEQDARLISMFNDRPNVERYNGAFRNCADFARSTINVLYPHAIRRNFIADFGLTTPKSVARGLTHYASKHPDTDLRFFVVPQVPGSMSRSYEVQGVTESLLKRYGVPLVVLSPIATGIVFVAYMGHGRLKMPRNAPVLNFGQVTQAAGEPEITDLSEPDGPPDLRLPSPSGLANRIPLSSSMMPHEGRAPVLEAPMPEPAERSPGDLITPFASR